MLEKYQLALTSAPEDDYLSVHIPGSDKDTVSLASSLKLVGLQPGTLEISDSSSVANSTKLVQDTPHFYVDRFVGTGSEAVFDAQVAILVGVNNGVLPLVSILKSIWYRMNSPRKATMVQQLYFFWICDNLESYKWLQSLLMAIEAQGGPIETYLVGTSQRYKLPLIYLIYILVSYWSFR